MSSDPVFRIVEGDGPIVATAIHDGHALRAACAAGIGLDEASRLREEDPHTARIAAVAPTQVIALRSRFEMDLNRPREGAVYRVPADAWGLAVWNGGPPPDAVVAESLAQYDAFYAALAQVLDAKVQRYGGFVVLDIHSYNHRRDGAPADPALNPEVNLGTESVDRRRWGGLVARFARELAAAGLDVRENVKFKGGRMSRWIHERFPATGCALAIEFKKTFMDEWTGAVDEAHLARLRDAVAATLPGLAAALPGALAL